MKSSRFAFVGFQAAAFFVCCAAAAFFVCCAAAAIFSACGEPVNPDFNQFIVNQFKKNELMNFQAAGLSLVSGPLKTIYLKGEKWLPGKDGQGLSVMLERGGGSQERFNFYSYDEDTAVVTLRSEGGSMLTVKQDGFDSAQTGDKRPLTLTLIDINLNPVRVPELPDEYNWKFQNEGKIISITASMESEETKLLYYNVYANSAGSGGSGGNTGNTATGNAVAMRRAGGSEILYDHLADALAAAASTDTIWIIKDFCIIETGGIPAGTPAGIPAEVTDEWPVTVSAGKTITLLADGVKTIKRRRFCGQYSALLTVPSGAALTLGGSGGGTLIIDGNSGITSTSQETLVRVEGGALTMREQTVLKNNISAGAAVQVESGSFTMAGGEISGNKNADTWAGGVFVRDGGLFTMSGGAIKNNEGYKGGGVFINGGIFDMSGGAIAGNTLLASSPYQEGKGVRVAPNSGELRISNAAVIAADNDVYLPDGKMITITGALAAGAASAATITPEHYSASTQVLNASGTGDVANSYGRFALTPAPGTASPWAIGSNGWLFQSSGGAPSSGVAARGYPATPVYYSTLAGAIAASPVPSSSPDTITILQDIDMDAAEMQAIAGAFTPGKNIKLTVPAGATYTLKRMAGGTGTFFTVGSSTAGSAASSLTLEGNGGGSLILDGGAVWTGGTVPNPLPPGMTAADFPSPAFGATFGGIAVTAPLVKVMNGSTLAMNTGAVLRNNVNSQSAYGNNVHIEGIFTMVDGTISGNKGTAGGVYVSNTGTFTMLGGTISGNNGSSLDGGGGITIGGGAFTMLGGTISGNSSSGGVSGGGVSVTYLPQLFIGGTFNMADGTISGNFGTVGGVSIVAGTFEMSGGTISGNLATSSSSAATGGVCVYSSSTFTMSGGTISGNSVLYGGCKGVYNFNTFNMFGNAVVAADNEVYLPYPTTITITGPLGGTGPVATITPYCYLSSTQVLNASGTGDVASSYNRFAVTQIVGPLVTTWYIDSAGQLQQ